MNLAGFLGVGRHGSNEISSGGYTYYWSSTVNGAVLRGMDLAISDRHRLSVVEVTAYHATVIETHLVFYVL